jgi:hypothetical protein
MLCEVRKTGTRIDESFPEKLRGHGGDCGLWVCNSSNHNIGWRLRERPRDADDLPQLPEALPCPVRRSHRDGDPVDRPRHRSPGHREHNQTDTEASLRKSTSEQEHLRLCTSSEIGHVTDEQRPKPRHVKRDVVAPASPVGDPSSSHSDRKSIRDAFPSARFTRPGDPRSSSRIRL